MNLKDRCETLVRDRKFRCNAIIHAASAAAGAAAGASVVPGSDSVSIAPIQLAMVAALAKEHGIPVTRSALRSALFASMGTMVGKGAAQLFLRYLPGVGNVVRAGVAVSVTQAVGRTALRKLEIDGSLA